VISEVRFAAASLAPFPTRLYQTETAVRDREISPQTIMAGRNALLEEAAPVDDIRSTAEYRRAVAANLLEEFLRSLVVEQPR
jgi:CO/xanthine dehydrogenase FAD-binding subunit